MFFNKPDETIIAQPTDKNIAGYVVISITFVALLLIGVFPQIIGL